MTDSFHSTTTSFVGRCLAAATMACTAFFGCTGTPATTGGNTNGSAADAANNSAAVVFGYNDLGMHCMNQDFSEFMILPPYNTLHAQVVSRSGDGPQVVTDGITVAYSIPGNTYSVGKTNFWDYAPALFGVPLQPNVGLTGNALAGNMSPTGDNDWAAIGIPITPLTDAQQLNSFSLADIRVSANGQELARTQAVIPVSWEISCDLCHNGSDAPASVLAAHDTLHGTNLQNEKPVLCARCHQQAPLGAAGAGQAGVSSLSRAMHHAHASRMDDVVAQLGGVACYACHPGKVTQCFRDVHFTKGMDCMSCHTSMDAVADPSRRPWVDEPRCVDCHQSRKPQFAFEQSGKLYRASKGHGSIHCEACHGSPHAITPTVVDADNVQAIALQGHAGVINTCSVCHASTPEDAFFHTAAGD